MSMSRFETILGLLQRIFISRLGSSLLGLTCILALVWYAGPLVGLDGRARLYVMLGLLAAVAAWCLARWLIAHRRGAKLEAELHGQVDERDAQRQAEISAIKEKMDEAIASLRSSELGITHRGKAALYALPWYMVIGPSAAGKSTLLRQSGLHFPYANSEDLRLRGFGGTRNCDWWFSDEAILLDTAGRYTTEEDDREEWLAFLAMLRKHRGRMPINGVLVAISMSDLLIADSEGLERHVAILRERINELMKHLGVVFPVFIVFTKCDLIRGFEAFFEDLSEHERNQVWGSYLFELAATEQDPAGAFEGRMRELYAKLCELRLRKLSMQRKMARKAAIFDFPNQFQAAADQLGEFIQLLFRANPYQETPRFAGVYFTSGTQEGTPLARLVGSLRQAFGYDQDEKTPREGIPKSYFIKNLFTDVIFQLQGAVRGSRTRLLWDRWLKGAAVAGGLASLVGAAVLLSGAYATNSLLLNGSARVVQELQHASAAQQPDPAAEYQALEAVYANYLKLLENERARPLQSLVGIYTADQQIPVLADLLQDELEHSFRDRSFLALEYRLENLARQWEVANKQGREELRDQYYQALRAYLMVTFEPRRLQVDAVAPLLKTLWAQSLGLIKNSETIEALEERAAHLAAMVEFYLQRRAQIGEGSPWKLREELIVKAREQLRTPPNAEQMYAQIKSKAGIQYSARSIDDLVSAQNRGLLKSRQPISGLFTAKAWHEYVRSQLDVVVDNATRGDWVLSPADAEVPSDQPVVDKALAERLRRAIRELYFRDYADAWLDFLAGVQPAEFVTLQDGAVKLMQLARSDGPIGELMQVAAANINLTERPLPRVADLVPGGKETVLPTVGRIEELDVRLADLRRFTNAADKQTVSELVNQYLLVLSELKNEVERLAASVDVAREAQGYAASVLGSGSAGTQLYKGWVTTSSLLNGTDVRTREAMQGLFNVPTREVWRLIVGEARRQIDRDWQQQVLTAYQSQLQGKFPFAADGPDAALDDVAEFFRPGDGVLWTFVDQNLSPFLVEKRGSWQERRWLNLGLGFSNGYLRGLADAKRVTGSLFKRGGSEPEMNFYVYPVPTPGLSEMVLETNGQFYRYRNEPQEWRRFTWPGPLDHLGARVAGTVSRGGVRAELNVGGQWGLFHLLRKAQLSREGGTVYLTAWELPVEGYEAVRVSFRIRADRQHSIFQQQMSNGFVLPETVFVGHPSGAMVAETR